MKSIGFIDYYLYEFHAYKYPQWLKEFSGGFMCVTPMPKSTLPLREV